MGGDIQQLRAGWRELTLEETTARMCAMMGHQHRTDTMVRLLTTSHPEPAPAEILGDCWLWDGPTSGSGRGGGYGRVCYSGRTWAVHRLVWALCCGVLVPGKQIDHRCRRRLCFRPEHLEQVTHLKNQRLRALRAAETTLTPRAGGL